MLCFGSGLPNWAAPPSPSLHHLLQMDSYCRRELSKLKEGARHARVWKAAAASLTCLKGRKCPKHCPAVLDYATRHKRAVASAVRRHLKCDTKTHRALVAVAAVAPVLTSSSTGAPAAQNAAVQLFQPKLRRHRI